MTQNWEPGTQYNESDVVIYEGHRYKIIQAHISQSDWTPPVTPALWGRLQDEDVDSGKQENSSAEPTSQNQNISGSENESFVDKAKNFFHEHEKEAQIAGGVAAGAAILGAAGLSYKHHQNSQQHPQGQQGQQGQHGFLDQVKQFGHDHKKELEIGGGLLAAGAAIAGGYEAYKHHQEKKDED